MADFTLKAVITGQDNASAVIKQVSGEINQMGDTTNKVAEGMSTAFGMVVAQGLQQMSQALKQFGKDLIAAGQEYAIQVEDMARQTGIGVEESSRMIQVADDMRIGVGELSSALRIYSTKQAEAGGVTDISIDQIARLSDAYLALQPGVARTNFLVDNFGRGGMAMGKMMEQGGAKIREMGAAVEDNLILTDEMIAKQEALRLSVDKMNDAWMGMKIRLMDAIGPSLIKIVNFIADDVIPIIESLLEAFDKSPEGVKMFVTVIGGLIIILGALTPIIITLVGLFGAGGMFAGVGTALAGIASTISGALMGALTAVGGALAAITAPVWLLIAAIAGLVAAFVLLGPGIWNAIVGIVANLKIIWDWLVVKLGQAMMTFAKNIQTGFGNAWKVIRDWVSNIWEALKNWVKGIWDMAIQAGKNLVNGIWEGILSGWDALIANIQKLIDELLAKFNLILEASSPSKLLAREVGIPMAQGVMLGFQQGMKGFSPQFAFAGAGVGARSYGMNVGRVEYHGAFSAGEMKRLGRMTKKVTEASIMEALGG
jgi:hypothetical protein